MVRYRLYPSLLDEFSRYLRGSVSRENLLNRINRVRDFDAETLRKMQEGSRFEKAVLSDRADGFDPDVIREARRFLPAGFVQQYRVSFIYETVQFYGFADVVGEQRVIDLKTTSLYRPEKYGQSFQNLYLYALKDRGCESMEYVIYDFHELHHLVWRVEEIDFQPFLDNMMRFTAFLEENRVQITDPRIFVKPEAGLLF